MPHDGRVPEAAYGASGSVALGPRAVRADAAERVAQRAFERAQESRLTADASLAALVGCPTEELAGVLRALGYAPSADGRFAWRARAHHGRERASVVTRARPAITMDAGAFEGIDVTIVGLDHVQLAMPAGQEAAARRFYDRPAGAHRGAQAAPPRDQGRRLVRARRREGPPRRRPGLPARP